MKNTLKALDRLIDELNDALEGEDEAKVTISAEDIDTLTEARDFIEGITDQV